MFVILSSVAQRHLWPRSSTRIAIPRCPTVGPGQDISIKMIRPACVAIARYAERIPALRFLELIAPPSDNTIIMTYIQCARQRIREGNVNETTRPRSSLLEAWRSATFDRDTFNSMPDNGHMKSTQSEVALPTRFWCLL